MADRKKVIDGLLICLNFIDEQDCPESCPYFDKCQEYEGRVMFQPLMRDALALLKEQEEQIERLEHDLAVTQNNLNYYVNGNN